MKGYSKITSSGHKSISLDFSDFLSSFPPHPQTPKSISGRRNSSSNSTATTACRNINESANVAAANVEDEEEEVKRSSYSPDCDEEEKGVRFGVILGRSSSVSTSSSLSAGGRIQATMKRAFSMRRSSSSSSVVSERYCRIHDQSMPVIASSPVHPSDDHDGGIGSVKSKKKNRGSNKILKSCKRLFGF